MRSAHSSHQYITIKINRAGRSVGLSINSLCLSSYNSYPIHGKRLVGAERGAVLGVELHECGRCERALGPQLGAAGRPTECVDGVAHQLAHVRGKVPLGGRRKLPYKRHRRRSTETKIEEKENTT